MSLHLLYILNNNIFFKYHYINVSVFLLVGTNEKKIPPPNIILDPPLPVHTHFKT